MTLATKHLMVIKITSIYTSTAFRSTYFEVAVWRHFAIVDQPIRHSLFYNGHFSLRWLPLAAKLLKSHQIQTKNTLTRRKDLSENLSLKLLYNVNFPFLPGKSDFLALQCPIFNQMSDIEAKLFKPHQIQAKNL